MVNLEEKLSSPVTIGSQTFQNPIWLASGTAAFGEELMALIPMEKLGGIVLKGTSIEPREGNPPPRLVETPAGLLNAIGLQNPGIDVVKNKKIPLLEPTGVPIIINVAGKSLEEYIEIVRQFSEIEAISAYELNISCPNVKMGLDNGTDPTWIERLVSSVKKISDKPVIAKLTPNCTDITTLATAAENGGADALSLINTLLGMSIDIHTQKPKLANIMGGLSGPAIRPIAIRMVYQVRQKTNLPIIGMGGIMNKDDIFEFFLAGADIVQLGTLNFIDITMIQSLIETKK